jgi:hypothetical protein
MDEVAAWRDRFDAQKKARRAQRARVRRTRRAS